MQPSAGNIHRNLKKKKIQRAIDNISGLFLITIKPSFPAVLNAIRIVAFYRLHLVLFPKGRLR